MKIKQGYGLQIGLSIGGHIRLEQQDYAGRDTPSVVLLTEHESRILIKELQRLLKEGRGKLIEEDGGDDE